MKCSGGHNSPEFSGHLTPESPVGTGFVGSQRSWMVKVDSMGCEVEDGDDTTGILESISELCNPSVVPNPFSDYCIIDFDNCLNKAQSVLKIYDVFGRKVRQLAAESSFVVNRGALPAGLYFYELLNDGIVKATGKLIIE